jgi:alkanesulfonate monooxygenase SsuD/methylene tetrahydromethanopterin reductase-like flavin-dependent oxidoreductase (luciferase family)
MAELYGELIKQAQLAEELGFDTAWLAEHHFNNYVAQPSPFQLAAMLGATTSRIRLGIAVVVLTFHHPLRLAGELAQLDVLTQGRLDVAVGRGAFPWEAHQMGIKQTDQENRDYCSEHLLVMARALRSPMKAIDHQGKLWQFANLTIIPPTYTEKSPTFWVAAQRPESVPWAIESCLNAGLPPILFCSQLRRPFKLIEDVHAAYERELSARRSTGADVSGA